MFYCNKCNELKPLGADFCPKCGNDLRKQETSERYLNIPAWRSDPFGAVDFGHFIGASGSVANLASNQENNLKDISDKLFEISRDISSIKGTIPQNLTDIQEAVKKTQDDNRMLKGAVENLQKSLIETTTKIETYKLAGTIINIQGANVTQEQSQGQFNIDFKIITESASELLNDINENPQNYSFMEKNLDEFKQVLKDLSTSKADNVINIIKSKLLPSKVCQYLRNSQFLEKAGHYLSMFVLLLKKFGLI